MGRRRDPTGRRFRARQNRAKAHRAIFEALEQRTLLSVTYTVTDITDFGDQGFDGLQGNPLGINASGQVVGVSGGGTGQAFLYSNGTVTNLGTLAGAGGGYGSGAFGVNAGGQVVGYFSNATSPYGVGFLYGNGTVTELGTLSGAAGFDGGVDYGASVAYGINDSGEVVGASSTSDGVRAFLYSNGSMTNLGTLPGAIDTDGYGRGSQAYGINDSGEVVGLSSNASGDTQAFLYSNGTMTDLGLPGDSYSCAYGINASGQVVGYSANASADTQAFLYSNGTMTGLGTLGGNAPYIGGYGINDSGQVVGASATASGAQHAFLYSDGTMTDLNSLIDPNSGWTLLEANAINDKGQIVGTGTNMAGATHAFLLTPIGGQKLAFVQQSTDTPGGVPISKIQVAVEDASGNVLTTDNSEVTLQLANNSGGVALNGTLTEPTVNGVATFADLSLGTAGNYTLEATDGSDTDATSNPFNIGSIELEGNFANGVSSGTVEIGLTPTNGGAFTPLLEETGGTVSYSQTGITASGTFASAQIDVGDLFTGSFTIPEGATATSSLTDTNPSQGLEIANLPMNINSLSLVNPGGGSTANSEIELQGSITLPAPLNAVTLQTAPSGGVLITNSGIELASTTLPFPDVHFTLYGLGFSATNMLVTYDSGQDDFVVQGNFSLSNFIGSASVSANLTGQNNGTPNGITIGADGVYLAGSISLNNFTLPNGWGLNASFTFDTENDQYSGSAALNIPNVCELDALFSLDAGQLDSMTIGVSGRNDPVLDTGWFFNGATGSVSNLADGPITFGGSMTFSLGPNKQLSLPGWLGGGQINTAGATLQLTGSINADDINGSGTFALPDNIATASVSADFNMAAQKFSANGTVTLADGVFTGGVGMVATNDDLVLCASGTLSLPLSSLNFLTQWAGFTFKPVTLANGNIYLNYDTDVPASQDYLDLWGTAFNLAPVGVRVGFDGTITGLNQTNLPQLPSLATEIGSASPNFGPDDASPQSATFTVAAGTPWILLGADWTNSESNVQVQIQAPDGTIYDETALQSGGSVAFVPQLNAPTQTAVGITNPEAGNWTLTILDTSGLGTVTFMGSQGLPMPAAQVTAPSIFIDGQPVTVDYSITNSGAGATISLYYSTSASGNTGVPIVSGLSAAASGDYIWNPGILPSEYYYAYAVVESPTTVPLFSYEPLPSGTVIGDANGDGVVTGADFDILSEHLGTATTSGAIAGDFNGDGVVDYADFAILSNNFGATLPAIPSALPADGTALTVAATTTAPTAPTTAPADTISQIAPAGATFIATVPADSGLQIAAVVLVQGRNLSADATWKTRLALLAPETGNVLSIDENTAPVMVLQPSTPLNVSPSHKGDAKHAGAHTTGASIAAPAAVRPRRALVGGYPADWHEVATQASTPLGLIDTDTV